MNCITNEEWDRLNAIPESELKFPQEGVEYFDFRTTGWEWFGSPRWWEVYIVWDGGFNGVGESSCRQLWRQNGGPHGLSKVMRTDYLGVSRKKLLSLANPPKGSPA